MSVPAAAVKIEKDAADFPFEINLISFFSLEAPRAERLRPLTSPGKEPSEPRAVTAESTESVSLQKQFFSSRGLSCGVVFSNQLPISCKIDQLRPCPQKRRLRHSKTPHPSPLQRPKKRAFKRAYFLSTEKFPLCDKGLANLPPLLFTEAVNRHEKSTNNPLQRSDLPPRRSLQQPPQTAGCTTPKNPMNSLI